MKVNRMFRRVLAAGIAASLAGILSLGSASAQDFKIGVVATLSGPASTLGKDTIDGSSAWVKEINSKGGLKGKKVVLEIIDDETSPVNAVNAFRRLAADPTINMIWLATPSSSALAIKPLSGEFKVPVLSGGAVDALGIPAAPYFFKMAPAAKDFLIVILEYAKMKGLKRIATINATDAYGQAEAKHLKDNAEKYGVTVVAAETFQVTDTSFTPQLIKVRAANPDLIYNGSIGGPAILLFKGYKQLDMKTPLIMSQAALTKPLFDAVGGPDAVKGAMTPTQAGTIGEEFGGPTAALYVELTKLLGRRPLFFNSFGYDYGIITKHVVDKSDGSRDGIRAELDKIKDLPTINGIITFKPDDHTGTDYRSIRMAIYNGTKFEIAK